MASRLFALMTGLAVTLSLAILSINTHGMSELLTWGSVSIGDFMLGTAMLLPMVLTVVIPLATAAAITYGYHTWLNSGEIFALRAIGLSDGAIALPAVMLSAVAMVLTGVMSLYCLPTAFRTFEDIRYAATHALAFGALHEGVNSLGSGRSLAFATRLSPSMVAGVTILDYRDPAQFVVITAEHGRFVEQTGSAPASLALSKGDYLMRRLDDRTERLAFDEMTVPLTALVPARLWRGFFEEHIGRLISPPADLSDTDRRLEIAEGHRRIVSPLLSLGYGLFACALMLRSKPRRPRATLRALAVFAIVVVWHSLMALGHGMVGRAIGLLPFFYASALLPAIAGLVELTRTALADPPRCMRLGAAGGHVR
jgi:lipopolysaccharide export system permease protein